MAAHDLICGDLEQRWVGSKREKLEKRCHCLKHVQKEEKWKPKRKGGEKQEEGEGKRRQREKGAGWGRAVCGSEWDCQDGCLGVEPEGGSL